MKKDKKDYCTKHSLFHGKKYKSCMPPKVPLSKRETKNESCAVMLKDVAIIEGGIKAWCSVHGHYMEEPTPSTHYHYREGHKIGDKEVVGEWKCPQEKKTDWIEIVHEECGFRWRVEGVNEDCRVIKYNSPRSQTPKEAVTTCDCKSCKGKIACCDKCPHKEDWEKEFERIMMDNTLASVVGGDNKENGKNFKKDVKELKAFIKSQLQQVRESTLKEHVCDHSNCRPIASIGSGIGCSCGLTYKTVCPLHSGGVGF